MPSLLLPRPSALVFKGSFWRLKDPSIKGPRPFNNNRVSAARARAPREPYVCALCFPGCLPSEHRHLCEVCMCPCPGRIPWPLLRENAWSGYAESNEIAQQFLPFECFGRQLCQTVPRDAVYRPGNSIRDKLDTPPQHTYPRGGAGFSEHGVSPMFLRGVALAHTPWGSTPAQEVPLVT